MDRRVARPVSSATGNLGDLQFLRAADVCALLRISRPTLWRMRRDRQFPLPTSLSRRAIGWRRSDVESWPESRAHSQEPDVRSGRIPVTPATLPPPAAPMPVSDGRAPRGRKQLPLSLL
jgi:predicted DNA-binding transcriptional regulator AlpA